MPIYKKGDYVVIQNGNKSHKYFTIVNTKLQTHTHVNQLYQAKIIIDCCVSKKLRDRKYSKYIQTSIKRVMFPDEYDRYFKDHFERDIA